MRINCNEPLSPKAAKLLVLGCLLGIALIIVSMEYLRPHLDRWSAQMNSRRQAIEDKQSEASREASDEYKRDTAAKDPEVVPVRR